MKTILSLLVCGVRRAKSAAALLPLTTLFCLCGATSKAAITEGFESGLPTAYGSATSYSLGSGTWTGQANGIIRGTTATHSGSYDCQIRSQTGAQITTPILPNGVATITFWAAASTTSSGLQVQTSPDGTTFTQFGSTLTPGTSTAQYSITINDSSVRYIRFYRTLATIYLDDVSITDASSIPTISASGSLSILSTTYGTPSSTTSFSVSGANMTAGILVTAPSGFEVSQSSGSGFGATTTVGTSGTISSTTVYVRLAATASAGAHSGNVVCSGSGATSVNVATASSTVNPAPLTITDLTGNNKTYNGTTAASFTGTPSYVGMQNGEAATPVSGTPTATFATASAGNAKTITVSGYTAPNGNYTLTQPTLTANITKAPLTITANSVTKVHGATLPNPTVGSTAFTSSGLVNSETIGSVTISYTDGDEAGDPAQIYIGAVVIVPSSPTGGTFDPNNYQIDYVNGDLTVSSSPTITVTGTLSPVDTTYGSASASPTTFTVSAGNLDAGDLTVSAPGGFEVSTSAGSGYANSIALTPSSGSLGDTTIYVRLAATATVAGSPYSGNITVSGGGATDQTIATASSSVAKKALTMIGLTVPASKVYDRNTTAVVSGTPTLQTGEAIGTGTSSDGKPFTGDTVNFTGSATGTYNAATVAGATTVTFTGLAVDNVNYSLTQQDPASATITAKELTVTGATANNKTYDGTAAATITGATLVGVESGDTVSVTGGGTFADVNAATGIAVTAALTLGGVDKDNYFLTQPTGLTADITKASQTITFGALPAKSVGDAAFSLTATASSGLSVSYASSTPSVASVSGNTVTIVGVGTTAITASQPGNGNYEAATPVIQTLAVSAQTLALFNFPASSSLDVSAKATHVTVTAMALSSGTIETGITTGTYFPNEPYIEETGGWAASSQSAAKYFYFTVTADPGFKFNVTGVSYRAYSTSAGPSAGGFSINDVSVYSANMPDSALVEVSQPVTGQSGLSTATIKIQGWLNGSRTSAGSGVLRLDDVVVSGAVVANTPPLAADANYNCTPGLSVGIQVTGAGGLASDADGDSLSVTTTSPAKGTVQVLTLGVDKFLYYLNTDNAAGVDSFNYTVADGFGGTVTKTITITVAAPTGLTQNQLSISSTANAGEFLIKFLGIPGKTYDLESTEDTAEPYTWTTLATVVADVTGLASYIVTPTGSPTFYRTRWVP